MEEPGAPNVPPGGPACAGVSAGSPSGRPRPRPGARTDGRGAGRSAPGRRTPSLSAKVAGGTAARWLLGAAAAAALAGCDTWRCAFESHGACVEFDQPPADMAAAQARLDRLLELELAFWDLHTLSGWRIHYRETKEYVCYIATRNEGCTDYLEKTISVRLPDGSAGCFEAAELLHELGHYKLGDPMHANPRWKEVEAAFAAMVWDRPDAADECVNRYRGIHAGMWPVGTNHL